MEYKPPGIDRNAWQQIGIGIFWAEWRMNKQHCFYQLARATSELCRSRSSARVQTGQVYSQPRFTK